MVTIIKKGASKEEINALIRQLSQKSLKAERAFDAYSFCGKVKFDEDALKIQHRLGNEWK